MMDKRIISTNSPGKQIRILIPGTEERPQRQSITKISKSNAFEIIKYINIFINDTHDENKDEAKEELNEVEILQNKINKIQESIDKLGKELQEVRTILRTIQNSTRTITMPGADDV